MSIEDTTADTLETQEKTNEGVARATGILALGNVSSRALGLVRVIVQSNLFGATRATDAFKTATLIPTALYDLLIAGHVNGAIIPVLSEVVTVKGQAELWRLVSILISIVTVLLSGLVLVLQAFAPQVIAIFSQSDPQTQALATTLFRITVPALVFMGLFAVLSGTLYALRRFMFPALAGVVFNGVIVLMTVIFVTPAIDGNRPPEAITIMAIGWLAGAVIQMILQVIGLRGAQLRFTLNWRHPALRRIALLYTPVMFSLVMDTLIIRPFSYILADRSGVGAISHMDYGTNLIQFPQGLVATAISIAILPTLARQAALISEDSQRAFRDTLGLGLRLATTLIIPATIGLFVLATPIVELVFQHGAFTELDTPVTTLVLRLYLLGLPFAAWDLLLVYAFYARQDTLTPAMIGLISLAAYMLVAITLQPVYGLFSLMIADSIKHLLHAVISALLLRNRLNGLGQQRLVLTLLKTGIAASLMGVGGLVIAPILISAIGLDTLIHEIIVVGISGLTCVLIFVTFAALLRIEEFYWVLGLLRSKLLNRP